MTLVNYMKKKGIDFTIFLNDDSQIQNMDLLYYAKYNGLGAVIVGNNSKKFLLVPEMEKGKVKKKVVYSSGEFYQKLQLHLKKNNLKSNKIGINSNNLRVNQLKSLHKNIKGRFFDISGAIREDRQIKSENEIEMIKKSCAIASSIMNVCIKNFKNFKTEQDVQVFFEHEVKKQGVQFSFDSIVASGRNSAIPHYAKRGKLLKGFCVLDFGIKYGGYCSDVTRTIYLGKPIKKEIDEYNLLLDIQKKAILSIKPGVKIKKIVEDVKKMMGTKSKFFIHGLGHGVGLAIHESPTISEKSTEVFSKGMTVAIEPGLYYPNKFGIRIEDTILVGDKSEILTKIKKDLVII